MPLYEYECVKCDYHFDVRHGADEKPELSCPKCEGEVRKVFFPAGIIFKGSGWHIKDYAPKTEKDKARSDETKSSCDSCKTPAASCPKSDD